ncbi:hypothetical protein MKX01_000659 [Papaver californicum]|nr:hypothetical protein MKX01_000659 [Papaver californicum]
MSSVDVHRISTTKVRPASYIDEPIDNHRRINLNSWDLLFLRSEYMQKGLLFGKQQEEVTNDESINAKITHLKTSLSHTLDRFFPLAGRLAIEKHEYDGTISFIHATTDISVEDIVSPTYVPQSLIDPLFSLTGVPNYEGYDGAVFIGCSTNHSVCDGTSFWHFINTWSEIASSSENHTSCPPPVFERYFMNETDFPICLPFSFADNFLAIRDNSTTTIVSPPVGLVEKCFRFTKADIAALKARANLKINSERKQNMVISSLQAIFLVITPPLSETYSENSISRGYVTLKEGELLAEKAFGFLASLLKEVVNSHNDEKSRSFLESWIEKPFIPAQRDENKGVFSNMFMARSMNGKSYGTTTVSPGAVEGSVDIEICLLIEVCKAMGNDVEFMEAFST